MSKRWRPDFKECIHIEEELIAAKLRLIRSSISHPSEKGSAAEEHVIDFIRSLLPSEYGIGKGFITYHNNKCLKGKINKWEYNSFEDTIELSPQLDIVIYDALRGGPLIRLGDREVYPIENVFGYIEVKMRMDRKELFKCIKQSYILRKIQTKFYRIPISGTYTGEALGAGKKMMQIRSFIFAFDSANLPTDHLKLRPIIKEYCSKTKGFISGMYINGIGFFKSHHCNTSHDPKKGEIESESVEKALATFKFALIDGFSHDH